MEGYDTLEILGEGTYGVVFKAFHRASGRVVAIKKFKQTEDDDYVRKTSLRELRVLKQLHHPNVISLLDVFRRDGKLYLVFEFVEQTILQVLEATRHGMQAQYVRQYMYQLLRAIDYCHAHNIVHRDIKPENILVSREGFLKVCDFGFARHMTTRGKYTDYVATRWYRAPELLVGDVSYGRGIDVWAIGCIFAELSTSLPLFPGESDLSQLHLIMRSCGPVPEEMVRIFEQNPLYRKVSFPHTQVHRTLQQRFARQPPDWLEFLLSCLHTNPAKRASCAELMQLPYFTRDNFHTEYEAVLQRSFSIAATGFWVEDNAIQSPASAKTPDHAGTAAECLLAGEGEGEWEGEKVDIVVPSIGVWQSSQVSRSKPPALEAAKWDHLPDITISNPAMPEAHKKTGLDNTANTHLNHQPIEDSIPDSSNAATKNYCYPSNGNDHHTTSPSASGARSVPFPSNLWAQGLSVDDLTQGILSTTPQVQPMHKTPLLDTVANNTAAPSPTQVSMAQSSSLKVAVSDEVGAPQLAPSQEPAFSSTCTSQQQPWNAENRAQDGSPDAARPSIVPLPSEMKIVGASCRTSLNISQFNAPLQTGLRIPTTHEEFIVATTTITKYPNKKAERGADNRPSGLERTLPLVVSPSVTYKNVPLANQATSVTRPRESDSNKGNVKGVAAFLKPLSTPRNYNYSNRARNNATGKQGGKPSLYLTGLNQLQSPDARTDAGYLLSHSQNTNALPMLAQEPGPSSYKPSYSRIKMENLSCTSIRGVYQLEHQPQLKLAPSTRLSNSENLSSLQHADTLMQRETPRGTLLSNLAKNSNNTNIYQSLKKMKDTNDTFFRLMKKTPSVGIQNLTKNGKRHFPEESHGALRTLATKKLLERNDAYPRKPRMGRVPNDSGNIIHPSKTSHNRNIAS